MLSPIGNATKMAMSDVSNVPVTNGAIPKCLSANSGVHCVDVKNSANETSLKNSTVSTNKTTRIPIVVKTVIAPESANKNSIIFSRLFTMGN